MKTIRYRVLGYSTVYDPETETEQRKECLATVETAWTEEAEAHARVVAVGDVMVFEGEDTDVPTIESRVIALEDNSADLTEALDLLLSGATEEVSSDA